MNQRHLSDDRLIELCLDHSAAAAREPHLVICAECQQRRDALTELFDGISFAAAAEADAAFPAERLERQQARILQRIDQEGRPGRVIAFPAAAAHDTYAARTRPASRWVAGAAAAGVVIGLLAGQIARDFSGGRRLAPAPQIVSSDTANLALRPVSTTLSDDELLSEIENAIGSGGPSALRPLDVLTPRASEIAN